MGNFSLKNTGADKKYPYFVIDARMPLRGCADCYKTTNQPLEKSETGKALAAAAGGARSAIPCPYALQLDTEYLFSGGALWTA